MLAKQDWPLPLNKFEPTKLDKSNLKRDLNLGLLKPDSQLLIQKSQVVDPEIIGSKKIKQIIDRLYFAASGQRLDHDNKPLKTRLLIGVAAPQIGEMYRIILVDTNISEDRRVVGKLKCFINPEIIWRSRETAEGREGCFSTGLVKGLVRRPIAIKIRALTVDGVLIENVYEGFTARILQHEIDHLEGIRFPDRIRSASKLHWVHDDELAIYPKELKHWPRLCSRRRWESMKAKT